MPRNRSEKLPYECPDVEPDIYKVLRLFAEDLVKREVSASCVRNRDARWSGSQKGERAFAILSSQKQEAWYDWPVVHKRTYIADYMDYLYATQ